MFFQKQLYGLMATRKSKLLEKFREWVSGFFHDFKSYRVKSKCKAATPTGGLG